MSEQVERKTITDHLRQSSQKVIDPIVMVLAKWGVHPNALTLLGLVVHLPMAWLIANNQFRWSVVVGILSAVDALDGALARKLGIAQKGGFGSFLDSTSDRIAEIILFGGFIYYFNAQGNTLGVLIAYAAVTGSVMVSYARARAEGMGYSCKEGLLSRVERYVILAICGLAQQPFLCVVILAGGTWFTVIQRFYVVWQQAEKK